MILLLLSSGYLTLQSSWVQTRITQQIANRLSKQLNTNISVGKVEIAFFNKLRLQDVLIEDLNNDTLLFSHLVTARIDTLKLRKQRIAIDELKFEQNQLNISRDSTLAFNFSFILDSFNSENKDTSKTWNINCNDFGFNHLNVSYSDQFSSRKQNFLLDDLNLTVSEFYSMADSVSFRLNDLNLNYSKGISLKEANADVTVKGKDIWIAGFNMKSSRSEINNTSLDIHLHDKKDSTGTAFEINSRLEQSKISFIEISRLIPSLKGMNQLVEMSGRIYGDIDDLKGKNIVLETGQNTKAILDFYLNDISDTENMYLFLDLKQSETTFADVSNIRFPNKSKLEYLEFPESFYEAGLLKFKGNFSGFLSDFVTFGTFQSEMGVLTTDMLVVPEKKGTVYYRGNVSTSNFNLGRLFQQKRFGNITFEGSADGNYNKSDKTVSGIFKGDVTEIDFYDYIYKNIEFDGILLDKMFDGLLIANDPNLQFTFLGQLNLNPDIPSFDFNLNLGKALPGNLNWSENFPDAELAFKMKANFTGNELDNIDGAIVVENGYYKNRNGEFTLEGMELKTAHNDDKNCISFISDFFDINIEGRYNFRSILHSAQKTVTQFIPALKFAEQTNTETNQFEYRVNFKEVNKLSTVFVPGLEFNAPFMLYGNVDSENNELQLSGSIPDVRYNNLWARNIFIGNKTIGTTYSSKFRFSEVFAKNGLKLYNLSVDSKIAGNILDNTISWSNYDAITYSGTVKTHTTFYSSDSTKYPHIEIEGLPSKIYVADTAWNIGPYLATIDSSSVGINNLVASSSNQMISVDGKIAKGTADLINLELKQIDLSYLDKYFNKNIELTGIVNGTFGFANIFEEPVVLSDLITDNLHFKNQLIGDISLVSQWNRNNSAIDSELKIIRNNRASLNAFGNYKPSTKELNYDAEADSLSLVVLEAFIRQNFSEFTGHASGKIHIGGTLDKIKMDGAVMGTNAGLKIDVTQIPYHFSDTVYFKTDTIHFDHITIFDDQNNPGSFNGIIVHDNFRNMSFDLSLNSPKIRALNTTSHDNEQFYGTAIANGKLNITGKAASTSLTGTATTLSGTEIKISMESVSEIESYDFIEFVSTNESEETDFFKEKKSGGDFNLGLTIEATPDAKVQLIYNSQIGDVIKAQGEGILLFEMDNEGNMSLSGNYNPTRGDYLFTLQNVMNKRFSIEPGGSIVWSGDPYNAIIDLKALYKLKASLYDLQANNPENLSQNQRIQVECIINLTEELVNPAIEFGINFPNTDEREKDELQQFFNTEEEMNKQILSLIVLGKFYTPEYMRGTYEAQNTNMIGTTVSEVFSNQLSNWLSQISSDWDVGFNYRPGNEVTDDEIELALSTQIFNDRVTLNGNIGNNVNNYSNNSSQLVGDFDMNVKLVPSGKIQFKAYNRSNNNLIYETAPYTQGIGLSFKEEYNTISELVHKLGNIFKKKNR
ncbi:MAG: translocation/assembly module TamB domain-containing protein [Bacteroidota bacterium]